MPSWLLWIAGSLANLGLVLLPVFVIGKGHLLEQDPRFAVSLMLLTLWVTSDLVVHPSDFDTNTNVRLGRANGDSFARVSGLLILFGVWVNFCDLSLRDSGPYSHLSPSIGVVTGVSGIWLRHRAISTLGHYFTINLLIRCDQQLVSTGVYRLIRHPSYSGLVLILLGFSLVCESLVGVLYFLLVIVPLVLFRISREEKILVDGFGEDYQEYKKRTWRLLPFVI